MPLSIRPLHPAIAGEVTGIDITKPLTPQQVPRISRPEWTNMPCWCSPART